MSVFDSSDVDCGQAYPAKSIQKCKMDYESAIKSRMEQLAKTVAILDSILAYGLPHSTEKRTLTINELIGMLYVEKLRFEQHIQELIIQQEADH